MRCRVVFAVITMLPLFTTGIFAQQTSSEQSAQIFLVDSVFVQESPQ
jgi:hypothetical protein